MAYDLLIKNGIIIDGSGGARFRGDVGIKDGIIKDVGNPDLPGAEAGKAIAASGKFVTPGFVDITSHADKNWSLFQNPGQDYLLTQGVTTILAGNCGSSLAPLASPESAMFLGKWNTAGQMAINWLSVGEFLSELEKHSLGVNVGTLMGYGTIRRGVLRNQMRRASPEELEQIATLIGRGMSEGAFGLSVAPVYSHESSASPEEMELAAKVAAASEGVVKVHLRNEGAGLIASVNEAVRLGRESGAAIVISHLKAIGRRSWPMFKNALNMIERANESGSSLRFDISPYQRTGSFLYLLLPVWARSGGFGALIERIQNKDSRDKVIEALRRQTFHYDRYIVANASMPDFNGRTLAEASERAGVTPEEMILELLSESKGKITVFGKTLSFKNIIAGVSHSLGAIASDGSGVSQELGRSGQLVHPRSTGAMPHFLHKFVKERELLSWEEGIKKITSMPAEAAGFKNRGRISAGYRADIVIFDPEKIRDRSTYRNPYVHSAGIEAAMVNGKLAIENSELTGATAGEVLKKS